MGLEKACLRHLQPLPPPLLIRQRRLLQIRLLQLCHQHLHRPLQRHQHLQQWSAALACRTQIATRTHGVQMKLMLIGAQRMMQGTSGPGPEPEPEPATPSTSPEPEPEPEPETHGVTCKATPGLNRGVSDSTCAQCETGYKWWPCNEAEL